MVKLIFNGECYLVNLYLVFLYFCNCIVSEFKFCIIVVLFWFGSAYIFKCGFTFGTMSSSFSIFGNSFLFVVFF